MVSGLGGAWAAYRTAGSQARKQRQEGGESYVRASDGAVTTMQRIVDELEDDRNHWRTRAREAETNARQCEAELGDAQVKIRQLLRELRDLG